ncbi:MAG: MBL fold metallo-hydrolase [Pseudomonadota bacterium]
MKLEIFDVEHGACSLLTADNSSRMMFDCGHNASTGWKPGTHLRKQNVTKLEMFVATNYDEDHASGANDLFDNIDVKWLWRNKSVDSKIISHLKSTSGVGPGIERLFKEAEETFTGDGSSPRPDFQGLLTRKAFRHEYPTFEDENNLSFVIFLDCNGIGVLFTGDLEKAGWQEMLKQDDFRKILPRVNVLMAPHHGRESGCCEDSMKLMSNLFYVVVSDKGYQYDTQKTLPFYRRFTNGGPFRGENRHVLTTRNDGKITFNFSANGWGPE